MGPVFQQLKQRLRVHPGAGFIEVGLIGKETIGIKVVVRTKQLAGCGLKTGGKLCVVLRRRSCFPFAQIKGNVVTVDVILPDELIQLTDLRALGRRNAGVLLPGLVRSEMEIVGQAAPGKPALLRDQMVAPLGDHLALVLLRLTVVIHQTAMTWCGEQESSEVAQKISKWKQMIDDRVIVGNEMEK